MTEPIKNVGWFDYALSEDELVVITSCEWKHLSDAFPKHGKLCRYYYIPQKYKGHNGLGYWQDVRGYVNYRAFIVKDVDAGSSLFLAPSKELYWQYASWKERLMMYLWLFTLPKNRRPITSPNKENK